MLRGFVLSLVALSWTLAAFLAIQQVAQRNATVPLPLTSSLSVTDWQGPVPTSELRERLQALAEERGMRVGQLIPSTHDHQGRARFTWPDRVRRHRCGNPPGALAMRCTLATR